MTILRDWTLLLTILEFVFTTLLNYVNTTPVQKKFTTPLTASGVVTLGDPATSGVDIPAGIAENEYEYTCSPLCTSSALTNDVTVIGSLFHMHELGARVINFSL
jgi:hypothetical protein